MERRPGLAGISGESGEEEEAGNGESVRASVAEPTHHENRVGAVPRGWNQHCDRVGHAEPQAGSRRWPQRAAPANEVAAPFGDEITPFLVLRLHVLSHA